MKKLNVFYEELKVGELYWDDQLVYSFKYDDQWLLNAKNFSLSLFMPLQSELFLNKTTLSFFENLLPEGEVRNIIKIASQHEGTYDLLKEFGQDCAGAVIISEHETSPFRSQDQGRVAIEMSKVYKAIEDHHSVTQVILDMDPGYLSLAGAQDKFPAIYLDGKFYLPLNGGATSHIVKVPIHHNGVVESVYNEYYCMQLAQSIGFNVPNTEVVNKKKYPLFLIERYDRYKVANGIRRIHQQDFCQAQGFVSENKYESNHGPTLKDNYHLIVKNVAIKNRSKNVYAFLDWICFNLLIGNNDCHSKNISFLLKNSKIELAPFYDLLSTAIYPKLKNEFPFKIGGRNKVAEIGINQFEQLDVEFGLKIGMMCERMQIINAMIMEKKDVLAKEFKKKYPEVKIAGRISKLIADRSKGFKKQGLKL